MVPDSKIEKKTTCKRSRTRSQGLLKTMPFSDGYFTKLVRVNNRFRLEPVLVSTRAVPSLLTSKKAFTVVRDSNHLGIKVFQYHLNVNAINYHANTIQKES